MNVIDAVRHFLATELRVVDAAMLDPELPLVKRGVLDSIELMQVVAFLEREFTVRIDDTEILPSNLRSLAAIETFVRRKKGESSVGDEVV